MSNIEVNQKEISDAWKSKLNTDCEAFHVPLPKIRDYKEDRARVVRSSTTYRGGVGLNNVKIEVDVTLPPPIVRNRE